jgi:L-cysteine desulfidase
MKTAGAEKLLKGETAVVVGCTEPAAIAFAVQAARRHFRGFLDLSTVRLALSLSPEVSRNASTAVVPVVGQRGIPAASVAGMVSTASGFNPFAGLRLSPAHPLLRRSGWLTVTSARKHGIFIRAALITPEERVTAVVAGRHDRIDSISRNGKTVFRSSRRQLPCLKGMEEIARIAGKRDHRLESFARDFVRRQVRGDPSRGLAAELAGLVAARMCGAPLPVLTFTGSGNQGMFLGVPLRALYRKRGEEALPAIVFALLAQIHLCRVRKRISNECGLAAKSAPALAAGLAYARGKSISEITRIMESVRRRLKGMECRGALPSCGEKAARVLRVTEEEAGEEKT